MVQQALYRKEVQAAGAKEQCSAETQPEVRHEAPYVCGGSGGLFEPDLLPIATPCFGIKEQPTLLGVKQWEVLSKKFQKIYLKQLGRSCLREWRFTSKLEEHPVGTAREPSRIQIEEFD